MGLTLEDTRAALASTTVQLAQGYDRRRASELHYIRQRQLTKAADYNDVIIAYRNGAPVRVRDIVARSTTPKNVLQAGFQNNKPGVQLVISSKPAPHH